MQNLVVHPSSNQLTSHHGCCQSLPYVCYYPIFYGFDASPNGCIPPTCFLSRILEGILVYLSIVLVLMFGLDMLLFLLNILTRQSSSWVNSAPQLHSVVWDPNIKLDHVKNNHSLQTDQLLTDQFFMNTVIFNVMTQKWRQASFEHAQPERSMYHLHLLRTSPLCMTAIWYAAAL